MESYNRIMKGVNSMQFGIDKTIITPKEPCYMAGYGRKNKSTGVLDDIEINTFALKTNGDSLIISVLDSICLDESFCNEIRITIANKFSLTTDSIVISCIHTHSAPAFFPLSFEDTHTEPKLTEHTKMMMIESIINAYNKTEECTVELFKTQIIDLYGNRNVYKGSEDKEVSLFKFTNKNNEIVGCLCNMSAHPTILNGSNFLLSSDLLGHIRHSIESKLNCKVVMTNGTCGDVSTRFYRKLSGIDELKDTTSKFMTQLNTENDACQLLTGPIKHREISMLSNFEGKNDPDLQVQMENLHDSNDPMRDFYIDRLNRKIGFGRYTLKLIGQVHLIGNVLVFALPGDVLSAFGLKLKKAFPNNIVVNIGYSNTYCNYLVPKEEYGKYFETFNSRLAKGEADAFFNLLVETGNTIING